MSGLERIKVKNEFENPFDLKKSMRRSTNHDFVLVVEARNASAVPQQQRRGGQVVNLPTKE